MGNENGQDLHSRERERERAVAAGAGQQEADDEPSLELVQFSGSSVWSRAGSIPTPSRE